MFKIFHICFWSVLCSSQCSAITSNVLLTFTFSPKTLIWFACCCASCWPMRSQTGTYILVLTIWNLNKNSGHLMVAWPGQLNSTSTSHSPTFCHAVKWLLRISLRTVVTEVQGQPNLQLCSVCLYCFLMQILSKDICLNVSETIVNPHSQTHMKVFHFL